MDNQRKPRAREKKVVGSGKGVEIHGEGLGTGPVNNMGNYEDRKPHQTASPQAGRPSGSGFSSSFGQGASRPERPQSGNTPRPSGFQDPFRRPAGTSGSSPQRPSGTYSSSSHQRPSAVPGAGYQQSSSSQGSHRPTTRSGGTSSGGSGKLIMLVLVAAVLFFFGKNFLSGDNEEILSYTGTDNTAVTQTSTGQSSSTGSASSLSNLLSAFMSSGGSSVYDFSGGNLLSSVTGNTGSSADYFTSTSGSGSGNTSSGAPDTTVASGARSKFTKILGGQKDTVTLMVYMCGTDLESQNGMGTADIKEMLNADLGDRVNLLIYTGGCSRWRNNVVSNQYNQIYLVRGGQLTRLENNMGTASMTNPATLTGFIQYGAKNYPANRMMLILWDHGGGSVSGYGYDEKYGRNQSMSLAGLNTALKDGGVKFDFIGFDACLMGTVENGIMLSQYADYMIGSEETEPGVGWYYTNWLNKLGKNPGMSTIEIGKTIADDFVEVCAKQCRGQATTLSIVDLAELEATVPAELKNFSIGTNQMIQNKEYKAVSTARIKTREFAQASRIDQIDLVHFAKNMGSEEGKKLAEALQGAVKYNRTGGGISNAYGLSIYFPYKRSSDVGKAVSTYAAIGMDEEYSRCIQEFASLEISGQVAGGSSISSYSSGSQGIALPGLMESLMGSGNSYSSSAYGSSSGLTDLLGGLFSTDSSSYGGGSSLLDLFSGRSLTAERAAEYILDNHFDATQLVWKNGGIELPQSQWDLIASLTRNVFFDNGSGYIDLGTDNDFTIDGNTLAGEFDGTWMSINRQPVAYYYLDTIEDGDDYLISGYVPAILNGTRVNLLLYFDSENPYGYIAGAQIVYPGSEPGVEAKNLIQIGKGDTIQFICDFYNYNGNYRDSYKIGNPLVLGDEVEIANTPVGTLENCRVTFCFTDLYQQKYWTPAL